MRFPFGSGFRLLTASLILILVCIGPALQNLQAWNATGHRSMAFLAYSHLTPRARERVALILRAHPDFDSVLAKGSLSKKPVDVNRYAFTIAATWPDIIKSDPRFVDSPGASPRPLPGFPDMMRHQNWHYINTPVPAEFRHEAVEPVNALSEVKRLLKTMHKSGPPTPEEVYALPWILHLVTDLHQPLHTVSRFYQVNGAVVQDRGGNGCFLQDERNLHSLWDNLLGTGLEEGFIARTATMMSDRVPEMKSKQDLKPEVWVREGAEVAVQHVYAFPGSCADRNQPAKLPADYKDQAREVAYRRAAIGAYRLAALLNEAFGK